MKRSQYFDSNIASFYSATGLHVERGCIDLKLVDESCREIKALISRSDIVNPHNLRTRHISYKEKLMLEKIDPVIDLSKSSKAISISKSLVELAKLLLGTPSVKLFRDKAIIKPPGFPGYPLHQDFSWWHDYDPGDMVTFVIALEDNTLENGCIEFFLNSHEDVIVPRGERRGFSKEEIKKIHGRRSVLCQLERGTVVAFHPLTVHWSPPNLTLNTRINLYISFIKGVHDNPYERYISVQNRRLAEEKGTNSHMYFFK